MLRWEPLKRSFLFGRSGEGGKEKSLGRGHCPSKIPIRGIEKDFGCIDAAAAAIQDKGSERGGRDMC